MNEEEKRIHDIKVKTVHGLSLLIIREIFLKFFTIIGQLFLVRILIPEYFGIFAIISFILNICEIFSDLGLSMAIIQSKSELTKNQLSTIFFVKTILVFSLILILNRLIPVISNIYSQLSPVHFLMLQISVLTLLLKPLRTILVSLLERKLNYSAISIIDLSGIVAYYLVAIFLSLNNNGVWSFIIALIIKECLECLIAYIYEPWLPKLIFHFSGIKQTVKFGIYFQLGSVYSFINKATIPVLAGTMTTMNQVGLLDWSSNIASVPRALSDNVGRVSFATFSKIQENKQLISNGIEKTFNILSILTLFIILTIFCFGRELITYFLNPKWLPALPALYWFVASTFFLNGTSSIGHGIMAIGKTKILFYLSTVIISMEWILTYILLIKIGYVGISIAAFWGTVITFFCYLLIGHKIGFNFNLKKMLLVPLFILCISFLFIGVLNSFIPDTFILFLLKLVLSLLFYILFYYLLSKEDIIGILSLIRQRIS